MLDLVRRSAGGTTAAQVAEATGLHSSTVRAHLDQLVTSGLLARDRHGEGTPGRPAWRYHATGADLPTSAADSPYRDLAGALIAHLTREADDPYTAGVRAGRDWGRALAVTQAADRPGPPRRPAPLDGLVAVLDRLGFAPRIAERPAPDAAVLALRSCPFLDLALAHPDVVCGVHQGVIGGALGAFGASTADTTLEPFAVPGACLVRVRAASSARRGGSGDEAGPTPVAGLS
jgi:predicted ArsR family transcriptional regulator